MKRSFKICASALLIAALMLGLCACGGSAKSSFNEAASSTPAMAPQSGSNGWYASDAKAEGEMVYSPEMPAEAKPSDGYSGGSGAGNPLNRPDVKLIYTANLTVQTTEFDNSVKALRRMVEECGGYFENVYTYNGSYNYKNNYRKASYTIRVPASAYSSFVYSIGEGFHVVDQNESVQDIGLQYSETEGHIETLKIKQKRLQELLSNAVEMTDIIELENALSNCEYELESYSSTLNRYNSLIGYSTVCLQLSEVTRETEVIIEDPSFGARVARSFKNACSDFVEGCEDFVIWLVYNMFTLIIILIILILIFKFRILSRLFAPVKLPGAEKRAEKRAARKAAAEARRNKGQEPAPVDYTAESPDDKKGE